MILKKNSSSTKKMRVLFQKLATLFKARIKNKKQVYRLLKFDQSK